MVLAYAVFPSSLFRFRQATKRFPDPQTFDSSGQLFRLKLHDVVAHSTGPTPGLYGEIATGRL